MLGASAKLVPKELCWPSWLVHVIFIKDLEEIILGHVMIANHSNVWPPPSWKGDTSPYNKSSVPVIWTALRIGASVVRIWHPHEDTVWHARCWGCRWWAWPMLPKEVAKELSSLTKERSRLNITLNINLTRSTGARVNTSWVFAAGADLLNPIPLMSKLCGINLFQSTLMGIFPFLKQKKLINYLQKINSYSQTCPNLIS